MTTLWAAVTFIFLEMPLNQGAAVLRKPGKKIGTERKERKS